METDGIISPSEAFHQAVAILIEQFKSLVVGRDEIKIAESVLGEKEETKSTDDAVSVKTAHEKEEKVEAGEAVVEKTKKRGRPKKS